MDVRQQCKGQQLLILQPSSYCNLDCSYCYLPNRSQRGLMSLSVVEQSLRWFVSSPISRESFTLLWHVGEPLAVPIEFYQEASNLVRTIAADRKRVRQSIQTNATPITTKWCEFLRRENVRVSVSVDGPKHLHDAHRKMRNGRGSYDQVMHGMQLLKQHCIPFSVITVLTDASLDCPDELYEWYIANRIHSVGFNPEEVEGINRASSLQENRSLVRYRQFLRRFIQRVADGGHVLAVREFTFGVRRLLAPRGRVQNSQSTPWSIVAIDMQGNFSTFSPELVSQKSTRFSNFILGNVWTDTPADAESTEKFKTLLSEIRAGVEACEATCEYFSVCGGGAPSNKYFETGRFDSTITNACTFRHRLTNDVLLEWLEAGLHHSGQAESPAMDVEAESP